MNRERRAWLTPILWYAGIWTALVVVWALQVAPATARDGRVDWGHAFALSAINFYSSALVAIPITVAAWRRGLVARNLARSIALYAIAIAVASVVRLLMFTPLLALVTGTHYSFIDELRIAFVPQFAGLSTVLATVLAIRSVQLSNELTAARLQALQSQLHPHFLFNTLNAVSTLMHTDVDAAEEMLAGLCDLLRVTLRSPQPLTIPLGDELTILGQYVEIMKRRFPGKVSVSIDVPADVREVLVPPLVFQPLFENALQHGLNESGQMTQISLRAERSGGSVILHLSDNGPGLRPEASSRRGIGLENTRRRLEALYGARTSLTLQNGEGGGTLVTVRVPLGERL